jgi:hypothetical protein
MRAAAVPNEGPQGWLPQAFAGLFGALLGLSLIKFGNPVVLEQHLDWPANAVEWVFNTGWPLVIGYWLLGSVALVGLLAAVWKKNVPRAAAVLPLAWLAWEAIAATRSVDYELSKLTLLHFVSCVVCFYLGLFSLNRAGRLWPFWTGIILGFLLALAEGFDQHFGGLEETRRYFRIYHADLSQVNPEYIKRISSNRIFGTLLYANTFAGVILMLLPVTLVVFALAPMRVTAGVRRFLVTVVTSAALACLYWSGSKGGWLLMLLTGLLALLFLPISRRFKVLVIGAALVLGLTGFFLKHAGFFRRGAPSVEARFDYWRGAVQATGERPVFGSGPGTFGRTFERLKKPEWEMTRLAHNDYLQQASDSGVPGFLLYTGFVCLALICSYRGTAGDWLRRSVWLGALAWALQSTIEFNLYIPAMSWLPFTFLGWLLSQSANLSTFPANPDTIPAAK